MQFLKKIGIYCLGLFIMALGVAFSRASDLGVSPVNSIPCVLSYILDWNMGICTTLVFCGFIFLQFLIMGKDFEIRNLLQIICSFLFGYFVSLSNALTALVLPAAGAYWVRILYTVIGILCVALGLFLYLDMDVLSLPGEGVMQAISFKTGIKVSSAKIMFDWGMVLMAALLSLVFLGELRGVREGTVLAALGVGVCLKLIHRLLRYEKQSVAKA